MTLSVGQPHLSHVLLMGISFLLDQSLLFQHPKFQAPAVQPGLCRAWSETPMTEFLDAAQLMVSQIKTNTADCGRILTIPNGHVDLNNTTTTSGSVVPVVCDNGYELVGGSTVECREDGTWSDSVSCHKGKHLLNNLSLESVLRVASCWY